MFSRSFVVILAAVASVSFGGTWLWGAVAYGRTDIESQLRANLAGIHDALRSEFGLSGEGLVALDLSDLANIGAGTDHRLANANASGFLRAIHTVFLTLQKGDVKPAILVAPTLDRAWVLIKKYDGSSSGFELKLMADGTWRSSVMNR